MKNSEIDTYLEAADLRQNMKNVCSTELLVLSGLSNAVKQLRAENEKLKKEKYIEWISVDIVLPPIKKPVLAALENNEVWEAFVDANGKWQRGGIDMEKWYGKVTKWAYMPDPTKGCEE